MANRAAIYATGLFLALIAALFISFQWGIGWLIFTTLDILGFHNSHGGNFVDCVLYGAILNGTLAAKWYKATMRAAWEKAKAKVNLAKSFDT